MKRMITSVMVFMMLASCAPVLSRDVMNSGVREFKFARFVETPDAFKGKIFILGGIIVETKLTEKGSQIEAVFVPVDGLGYLRNTAAYEGRFIALFPRPRGMMDPLIYKKGREITIAGEFLEVRKGKIDEMDYLFPVFEIREAYLWDEYRAYPYSSWPPYYHPAWPGWCYDPWGRAYPCSPYWGPPW